jgi:hypothetical protein
LSRVVVLTRVTNVQVDEYIVTWVWAVAMLVGASFF